MRAKFSNFSPLSLQDTDNSQFVNKILDVLFLKLIF